MMAGKMSAHPNWVPFEGLHYLSIVAINTKHVNHTTTSVK